jgi:hypothetical protein
MRYANAEKTDENVVSALPQQHDTPCKQAMAWTRTPRTCRAQRLSASTTHGVRRRCPYHHTPPLCRPPAPRVRPLQQRMRRLRVACVAGLRVCAMRYIACATSQWVFAFHVRVLCGLRHARACVRVSNLVHVKEARARDAFGSKLLQTITRCNACGACVDSVSS